MRKSLLRAIAIVLVICAMQCCLVPAVTAASTTKTYDFYTPYKNYTYLFHWRVPGDGSMAADATKANSQVPVDYANRTIDWNLESNSGYGTIVKKTKLAGLIEVAGWVSINTGKTTKQVFRFRSPGTGNYNVDVNYYATSDTLSNTRSEVMIIPALTGTYTSDQLSAHLAKYQTQAEFSCYDAGVDYEARKVTIPCSFLENQEYFFVMSGGPRQADGSKDGYTYIRSLTANYTGEYDPPEDPVYPRPVTILEEALTRWEEGFPMIAESNDGVDYLAIPIYGGKMYVFNLETNQLVDVVNTGIDVPRGADADDNGVIYVAGAGYHIYKYDVNTNQGSKSTNVNVSGVSFGSLYDISYGEDGMLYTGTDKGHIIRYNPNTDTVTPIFLNTLLADQGIKNVGYVSSVLQQGDYIYAAITNKAKKHYLVKLTNTETPAVAGIVEYTSTKPSTYMSYMSITEDGLILGNATNLMVVDSNTMTLLTEGEFSSAKVQCYASEKINGKYYYVSSIDRYMYEYDPNAADGNKVVKKLHVGQFFDCHGKTVTLDRDGDGVDEQYLLAIESAKTSKITLVDPVNNTSFQLKLPIDENAGASTGVNSLTAGKTKSNELYYGGFTSNELHIYNTAEGKTSKITTAGLQIDAIYVDGDTIYTGNYTEAQLTKVNRSDSKSEVLMTLHNSLFNQSRIHAITGGDGKVFFGTFPYVYAYGGVLAWYDTNVTPNRAYVAVGPTSDEVYYSENAGAASPVWKDLKGNVVTSISGTTADKDVDGVDGVVLNQGIKDVAYHNGILYAATSREGGTNASSSDELRQGTSAVIIAYSVADKKVIATFDPAEHGFASPVPMVSSIELDENGTLWCIVSETLFTLTLNEDNTFTYTEKLSFDKTSYDLTQNRANSDIRFKDGYVYAAFERLGSLRKINMNNPSDNENLLPYVTSNGQVPESFAFGEDGNLYFLLGSSLKMLPLNETDAEWTAADAVTIQIAAITEENTSAEIAVVRAAYNALTTREKSLVQNYAVLVQAEADALIADIDALGEITWEKKEQVEALLAIYNAMPMSQQSLVNNYYVLAVANKQLLDMEANAPIVADGVYYMTMEDALASASGTIQLQTDVVAGAVDLGSKVLDLNGFTLTADSIVGKVMDSADGKGLIKVNEKNAQLTAATAAQLILWDNTANASGYRLFNYTFTNEGMNRNQNRNDAVSSETMKTTVKSFWSDLQFTNRDAYLLAASAYAGLEIGFEVTWTPDGGTTTSKTFTLGADTLLSWADAELAKTYENYCFFIELTGFDDLLTDGVVTVKPYAKTAFQTLTEVAATEYTHDYEEPAIPELTYDWGFGIVPA